VTTLGGQRQLIPDFAGTGLATRPSIDVERARRDTPGVQRVVHLNNAGAGLPPVQVTDAMIAHLRLEAEIGGYEAAAAAAHQTQATYTAIARLLNCEVGEVAVVESATRAWDMAFYAMSFRAGDRILIGRAEYASNVIAVLQVAARTGAVIEAVDDDAHGQLCLADLQRRLHSRTAGPARLIAMTHVPTQGGLVNPAEAVGAIARSAGVPFLLDACQSVGQLPTDVQRIGCDMLSGTGRKFLRGPRGIGFLYVRRAFIDNLQPPFLDMHAATWSEPHHIRIRPDARRFEQWEANYAAKIGLGVAIDYALSWGVDAIEARISALADGLRERLQRRPGVQVHDQGQRRCAIVSFTVAGQPATDIQRALSGRGINTSVSLLENTHLDLPCRGLPDLVRASVHYYNTDDELDQLVTALPKAAARR
jgi:selenocysteine lyase/cysteine desulfurase